MNWNSQKQSIKNSISNVRISGLIFLFVVVAGVFDSAFGLNTTCPLSGNVTPFKPSTSMGRCFKFQNSACCSTSDLQKLEQQISDDQIDTTYSSSPQCLSMFNDLYCATSCSPYQSEFIRKNNMNSNGTNINSNNGTSHTFEFYMDRNFCEDLFKACENVQLQGGMTVKDLFVNAVPFCQATSPLDYYVNVTTNDAQSFDGKDKPADPTKSFISSGPSLVSIGRDAVYVIQSADASGNLIYNSSSNNAFSISVSGPSSVIQVQSRAITPLTLTNNGDGTYSAIFTTLLTGDYSINARLNGQDISNSPRVTSFIAGSASALSYITCPAPRCVDGLFIPDEQIELTIVTLDALGNAITVGEDQFTVLVAGPETVYASVYDNADGTYLVSFSATQIGTYRIQAFLENTISIGNCSVTLAAGAVSPNTTVVYETETLHACDEENPSILTIQGYDTRGNKILTGGASFQVNVTGPSDDAQVNVVDHYDGSYRVQYSVKIAGIYNIHVSFHGIELSGSPTVAFLEAGVLSVNTTSTYGEGLDSTQEVGESANITIVPSDACNNNITDEDIQFNVIITKLSSGQQLKSISSFASVPSSSFSKVEYNNGVYQVTYKLKQTGIYSIDIQQGGVSLASFPIQVEAINSGSNSTGPACLGCVEVIGSASSVASSSIGVTNELLIETENCKGNLQNTDGEFNVFFSYDGTPFSNSSFSTSIENVGNGRYALSYTAQISGEADLFVQVKKSGVFTDVTGSPFQINFINGATCLNDCSGYGACVAGVCQCAEFHSGADCSLFDTPKITAVFTEGANILVTFSLPTNRAEMEYVGDCDNIFSSANVAMFGNLNENECTWLSDSQVLIRLGYDATISLGDSLEINNPKLKTLSSQPTAIEDTVLIEGPYYPESPYVQIIAPSIINTCQEEVVVDARSSLGNLNRPFIGISWNLVAIDGLDSSSQQFIDFANYLSYQNTLLLTLNPQTMQTGVTYTIELVVHNYLNGEGRGYANIYVTDVHSPVVTIQAPSTLKIKEDQGITIRAEVTTPCGNGDLSFAWTRSHFIDTPEQPLPISGTTFKDLYIPPYTFSADTTFVLQLIASVNHNIYGLGKDTVIVQVEKASPYQISYENVMINTQTPSLHAQKRTLSRRSSLVLDASTFLYKSAKEADYEIRWACSQIEPIAECKSCLDKESYDFYLKGKTRVAFPPSTFHPGVYKFVASIYDIGGSYQSDNALGVPQVEVEFVSSGVPEVFIKPVPIKSLNYGEKITFQGQIIGADSFTWSLFAGEEEISLEDEPDVKQGYNGDIVLIFKPRFLKAGVTYTVSLIATNSEGSGKSEMTFTVNAPPQGGKLEISPSSGNAFSTKFALLANNFGDAEMNYPFTYEYYFVNSNGKELPLSIGIDLDNSVEVTLPHNAKSVVVYVSDSLGAYTRSVVDVEVIFVKSSNKKRDQHGDDILYSAERLATVDLNGAIANGDMESATHVIFSILALLNDPAGTGYNTNDNTRVSIRSKIIDLIQSSAFGVSDSTSGRVILGQIITGLAECPNELTTNYAYRLSNSLVSLTTSFSIDGISGYSGYKESFSPSILNTVSNLLSKTQPANKQAQFSSNGLKSLQLLAFALLEDDTVYDDPIEITGDDIYLQTDREMVSNLQLSFSSSEHHLSMVLSDEVADSLSTQGITSVDTLFVASRANIYSYASTLVESSLASYQVAKTGTLSFDNIKLAGNVDDLIEVTIPFNRNWPYQVCQSWDSSSSSWSAGACSLVSTDRTAGTVTCSCDGKSLESISGIYATEVGYAPLILDGKGPVGSMIAQMTLAPDVNVGRSTLWWLVLVIVGVAVVTIATLLVYRHHQAKKRQLEVESIEAEPIPQVVVPINANDNVKYEEPEVVEVVNRIKLYGGKSDSDETQSLRVYPIKKYSSSSDGSDDSTGVVEKPRKASIKNENDESEDEAIGRTKKAKEESSSSDSENKKKSSSEEEGSLLKRKGGKLLESSSSSSSDQEEVKRSNKSKIIEESSGSSSDTSSEEEEIKRGNTSSRLRED